MGAIVPQVITEDRAGGGQVIDGSLRFDSSKSNYLSRTPSSAGSRTTWTWSGWLKKTKYGAERPIFNSEDSGPSNTEGIRFTSSDTLELFIYNGSGYNQLITSAVFRDVGWYHIVAVLDTTNATSSDRMRLYVNGVRQTAFGTATYPNSGAQCSFINTTTNVNYIGRRHNDRSDNYFSNFYLIDGQALDPSYFGYTDPLTNTWRPKKFSGSYTFNPDGYGIKWSDYVTGSVYSSSYYNGLLFDGNATDSTVLIAATTQTFTPPTPIPVSSSLRVFVAKNGSGSTFTVNGTSYAGSTTEPGSWVTIPGATQLSTMTWGTSGFNMERPSAIEVDGKILVDYQGTNSFYLPFDGNSPIGQDQSGRGNNWTPVNFGGSNTIEKATGALPILNTDGGGKVARVGVRTDNNPVGVNTYCVLALPLVGNNNDISSILRGSGSNKNIAKEETPGASSAQSNFYGTSYYFDGNRDHLYSTAGNDPDFKLNGVNWTVECWVYPTDVSGTRVIMENTSSGSNGWSIQINSGEIEVQLASLFDATPSNAIVANKWTHVAVVRSGSTTTLYMDGISRGTTSTDAGSESNASLWIGSRSGGSYSYIGYMSDIRVYKGTAKYTQNFIPASSDPDILPDTPSGVAYSSNVALVPSTDGAVVFDGSGDYLSLADNVDLDLGNSNFTIEGFVYVNSTSGSQQTFVAKGTGANNQASYHIALNTSGNWVYYLSSNGSTWDIVSAAVIGAYTPNAWQHIALVRSGNTFTPYLNGIAGTPTTSSATLFDSNKIFSIGADDPGNQLLFGFTSNVHVVKGTALYTSNFTPPSAPISSVANTKLLCCKSNSSATVYDVSPGTITANGNAVASNFNPFTVNINTQRGQESGYCTLNPLDNNGGTLSDGNLTKTSSSGASNVSGTVSMPSGKWYWEVVISGSANGGVIGIGAGSAMAGTALSNLSKIYGWAPDGNKYANTTASSYAGSYTVGDVIGVSFDADTRQLTFYKNNISQGVAFTVDSGFTYFPQIHLNVMNVICNFGQKPFKFPPPPGFQSLALANTPRPTIVRPDQYVGVTTYTGNGATRSLNVGFKPDFSYFSVRSGTGYIKYIFDSVRGATKYLATSHIQGTNAEGTDTETLKSFDRNGVTIGNNAQMNESSANTWVSWHWKAGGNSNTFNINDIGYSTASAAGLTAGTITPTGASVNTKSGFSIITYTGTGSAATISHGLGNTPSFMIIKNRDDTYGWYVYHTSIGATKYLKLNENVAQDTSSTVFNDTSPTSTVFSVGTFGAVNGSTQKIVAYLWAEIPGFSKFGSYTGNQNADGPVIITGFRPRWIMLKASSVGGTNYSWYIYDTSRDTYNITEKFIQAETNAAESTGFYFDILSNGFKVRTSSIYHNSSGATYIYAAFAETPSFNLYGGQANAR